MKKSDPKSVKIIGGTRSDLPECRHRRKGELFLIELILHKRKVPMNLKSRIKDSDDAHQNHQTGGKKIHDEL
jgi:hypothetical protein